MEIGEVYQVAVWMKHHLVGIVCAPIFRTSPFYSRSRFRGLFLELPPCRFQAQDSLEAHVGGFYCDIATWLGLCCGIKRLKNDERLKIFADCKRKMEPPVLACFLAQ